MKNFIFYFLFSVGCLLIPFAILYVIVYLLYGKKALKFSPKKYINTKIDFLNQEQYYRFIKFVDNHNLAFNDSKFKEKIFKIKSLIKQGKRDIKEIAKETECTYEECVLKIKYLQSQHLLTQFHIDHKGKELIECTPEELKLIKKYTPFIYNNNFTLDEIVTKKRHSLTEDFNELRDVIFKELKYLVDNDLVNDIRLNEVDKEIIYCTEEENKRRDFITVVCPNCGALNDINKGDKKRCEYCKTIIDTKKELEK